MPVRKTISTHVTALALAAGALLVPATAPATASAADWLTLARGKLETVQLDASRVVASEDGIRAWSRIELGREVKDAAGPYNAIEAQNLYDCAGGRFTTLRRVYFKGDTAVREEAATREKANRVLAGSIDERLHNAVCKSDLATYVPPASSKSVAAAGAEAERPTAMHADMRSRVEDAKVRVMPVADTHVAPAPAAPASERPRMIQLPAIDKERAAAEAAAAGVSMKPPSMTGTASAASAAAAAAGAAPAPMAPIAPHAAAQPALRPAEAAAAAENRHTREFLLATSGPRKAPSRPKPAVKKAEPAPEANPAKDMHVHWGYDGAGAPENWGKLRPDFATCASGKRQSPIDIRDGIRVDLEAIKFDYKPTRFRILDNGHTVQVTVGEGSTLHVMGKRYELVQFHFHKPSEERVNGRPFDMVIHFVHRDYDGNLAVVAVLLESGAENPQIQTLWNNMPLEQSQELTPADVLEPAKLLPENRAYWTYMGSLTTPPCSENVLWMVMKQAMPVSAEQIAIFGRLYKNNARPVQAANGRLIKGSR